ncbi:hypothetical protein EUX98_g1238 [Antrodiella citrinella]|uniref:Domain of unknown function at the cortex 1 domain-containing protein n=1 Tax=Antrodiella citrinella TaxID=2447956 RepID=A0A4S4N3I7_9APHY|nr:hypothetical protein EUX98_g1238 [Antrodiella citrinella]
MPRTRLRILAGPTFYDLSEIEPNSGEGFPISTDAFEGRLAVYIKGFPGGDVVTGTALTTTPSEETEGEDEGEEEKEEGKGVPYFDRKERDAKSWSIQFQGRFLQSHTADDILVGAAFDYPLSLPWGFSAVTGFMQFIDRTLVVDTTSAKPSALSPLITAMPFFSCSPYSAPPSPSAQTSQPNSTHQGLPAFPASDLIADDFKSLRYADEDGETVEVAPGMESRRKVFRDAAKRKLVKFGPEDLITADYVHGHLTLAPTTIAVHAVGLTFNMMQHWDGRPVRFICCERLKPQEPRSTGQREGDGMPWGRVFWCVALERVSEDSDSEGPTDSESEGEEAFKSGEESDS